jgi:hypothetical protein
VYKFIEVVRTIQACEQLGIKTVFLTSEDDATDAAPTMLEPLPEADVIVSTSFFKTRTLDLPDMPPVQRVIGVQQKAIGPLRDQLVPTAGSLLPPPRHDDHYGFMTLSCIEY